MEKVRKTVSSFDSYDVLTGVCGTKGKKKILQAKLPSILKYFQNQKPCAVHISVFSANEEIRFEFHSHQNYYKNYSFMWHKIISVPYEFQVIPIRTSLKCKLVKNLRSNEMLYN